MSSVQTLPRQYSGPNPYASQAFARRDSASTSNAGIRLPRLIKRLFKFPQMDFELAVWEMTTLLVAPRKVFRNMFYHTYATSDPAFLYLLSFFLLLTSLAWSLAYATPTVGNILRIAAVYIFMHMLSSCLVAATLEFLLVPRLFGPDGVLRGVASRLPGGRGRGLFAAAGADGPAAESLEWGFCFDVALRAYLPIFLDLYIVQFLLLPLLASHRLPAVLLSNSLHLLAAAHALYINWMGFASLPFLSSTHLLLVPALALAGAAWVVCSAVGWNASLHLAPVLWSGGGLRKVVGGAGSGGGAANAGGSGT